MDNQFQLSSNINNFKYLASYNLQLTATKHSLYHNYPTPATKLN